MAERRTGRRLAFLALAIAALGAVALLWSRSGGDAQPPVPPTSAEPDDEARAALERRLRDIETLRLSLPAQPPLHTLAGRVVDGDERPVADVDVVLGGESRATRSAADGRFAFDRLPAGMYSVEARDRARVGGPVNVALHGDTPEVTLRLLGGAWLEVEVVSAADERPIEGADVEIHLLSMYEGGGRQRGQTGADGKVRFPGLSLVAHNVRVSAPGYAEDAETVDPMELHGERLTLRVELEPGATVSGRVLDPDGAPVEGAVVELAGDSGANPRTHNERARYGASPPYREQLQRMGTLTDRDGRFVMGVATGRSLLAASAPGLEPSATSVMVAAGQVLEGVEIVLGRGRTVSGVVVTSDDLPVPGAEVVVRWEVTGRVERRERADGTGRFEIRGLPPAPLELAARGETGQSARHPVNLSEAERVSDVLLVLELDGVITGEVLAGGRPVPGAQVITLEIARGQPATHPAAINADDQGRFRIDGIGRGRIYSVMAQPQQDGDWWFRQTGVTARAGEHVVLEIPADGSIAGRVELAGGGSLAGVAVAIEGSTVPRRVDRRGSFLFEHVPPRPHTLLFTGPGIPETRMVVALEPAEDRDLGTVRLPRGRTLTGQVLYESGEPAPVVDVTIMLGGVATGVASAGVPPDGDGLPVGGGLQALTDEQGWFSQTVPADLTVHVIARHRRGGVAELVLQPEQPSTGLRLRFTGNAVIEGSVTAGDEPMSGVILALRRRGDTDQHEPLAHTETDDAGYYRLEMVAADTYELIALVHDEAAGHARPHRREIEVTAGQRLFANFELAPRSPGDDLDPPAGGGGGGGGRR